nr:MAG TPA: hypothetical protein [Caudoviricetes sp.]
MFFCIIFTSLTIIYYNVIYINKNNLLITSIQ